MPAETPASRTHSSRRSRRTHIVVSALLSLSLIFSGCASTPKPDPTAHFTGDHLAYNQANIALASPRNKVLWQYRAAGTAMRRDQRDLAKTLLDEALANAALNYGQPNADAAKSRRLFQNEASKPFVGEPYERVMANFYRALLYWTDGELDNARALFRNAALIDSDSTNKTYAADYVLLDYLDGLLAAKLASATTNAGSDALARARLNATVQNRPTPPDYDIAANTHIFVEYGRAPYKNAGGNVGEKLQYFIRNTPIKRVQIHIAGQNLDLPIYDDLGYQAITRGTRLMDQVLANKVGLKKTSGAIAQTALAGSVVIATTAIDITKKRDDKDVPKPTFSTPQFSSALPPSHPDKRDEKNNSDKDEISDYIASKAVLIPVAIVVGSLAVIGATAAYISEATKTEADTRAWENLPRYLCYTSLRLSPGEHAATLVFLDEDGKPVPLQTQNFTITIPATASAFNAPPSDTIIFRSQLHD